MKYILLSLSLFFSVLLSAQTTGSVAGKLIDKEFNNEPLAFANILIKGTVKGTTSDIDGLYIIENLEPGDYIFQFSFVGYETQEINASVVAGKVTEINVPMGANSASLDEIIITTTTKRESEVALLLEQKKAVEIKQSIGADELSRKGIGNAASAVAKISGVSKQEGSSNVYVRGLGDRYLTTTLNGLPLPSNDVNKKNINLDLFASDVIENVSISKAYTSNFYGDFAAGNVDISSKDYTGDGFITAFIGSGVNTQAADKNFVKSEGTGYFGYYNRYQHNPFSVIVSHGPDAINAESPVEVEIGTSFGKSFNFNDGSRLSVFGTASFKNDYEYRKGVSVDYNNVEKKAFDFAEEFEYGTATTIMANINFRADDSNKFSFNSIFNNSSADVVGKFGGDGTGRNRDAILNTDSGFYQNNIQFDETIMIINQLLGNHKINDKLEVDWATGYNVVLSRQPDRKRFSFENYQFALDNNPLTNPTFYSNVVFDNQRYFQDINDKEFNGRLNVSYDPSDDVKFNIGYNARSKKRNFENIRYGYDIVQRDYQVEDVNSLNSVFSLANLQTPSNSAGLYTIQSIKGLPGLGNTNIPSEPENTFKGVLNIFAGYVNAEISPNDKWLLVPGIRIESFDQSINYDVINLGNSGIDKREANETFILPNLNIRYALNDDQNLRLSLSKTVSIPEFKEVAPFVYENISTRIGGNPDLLGSTNPDFTNVNNKSYSSVYNIDLKYEWFPSKSELFSISAFAKRIENPVNLVVSIDATGTQRYFRTGDKAEVFGVELDLKKTILKDEDDNNLLSFGLNATYMHTKQDLYSDISGTFNVSFNKQDEELQGASPLLINADINYSPIIGNYKPMASLVFSYFDNRIDALGSGQLGNIVEESVPTLDFILKNKIGKSFELNFSAQNLLNPKINYFRETSIGDISVASANGKSVTNYKRGIDFGLQFKYNF